ncbi:hypothetical protein [Desulforhopalus sp. IMCC35007]|uniref:hypothetical protein n=1 Tax=Desulforhopalus sp. IMCC35007 TaxID=2569543 RepID=UPI0010AE5F10|nr:hypothetical protein [Desulforhopalus sp. IMCC35007]
MNTLLRIQLFDQLKPTCSALAHFKAVGAVTPAAITAGAKDVGEWKVRSLHHFINKRYIREKQGYELWFPLLSAAKKIAIG